MLAIENHIKYNFFFFCLPLQFLWLQQETGRFEPAFDLSSSNSQRGKESLLFDKDIDSKLHVEEVFMRASQRKNLVPHGKASTILAATLFQDRLPAVARQLTVAPPLNSSGCPRSMRMRIHLLSVQPRKACRSCTLHETP